MPLVRDCQRITCTLSLLVASVIPKPAGVTSTQFLSETAHMGCHRACFRVKRAFAVAGAGVAPPFQMSAVFSPIQSTNLAIEHEAKRFPCGVDDHLAEVVSMITPPRCRSPCQAMADELLQALTRADSAESSFMGLQSRNCSRQLI